VVHAAHADDAAYEAPHNGFYVCPPDLQISSTQLYESLYFPQSPNIDLAFDFSILPPPVTWYEEPALFCDADFMSVSRSQAEVELGTSSAEEELLVSVVHNLTPEDYGTSMSSPAKRSSSTSSPCGPQFDTAMPLVCCDCPHRPCFGHPHQYKCVLHLHC
jgi:hypothetical protein